MTSVSFAGGGALSAELMRAMDEIAREQRQDHRDAALHEADVALHEGLAEADDLRGQAASTMRGAIIGGTLTVAGGATQAYSAAKMDVATPGTQKPALDEAPGVGAAATTGSAAQGHWNALSKAGETAVNAGTMTRGIFEGLGGYHAASAAEHQGRAQAASRRAEAEQSDAQEAQKMSEKARDLHQQILGLDHASRMAVLRG